MKKVMITSKNPVKINAVKIGFEKMFPGEHFEFESVSVPSNVKDQPTSNQETMDGAINRAEHARTSFKNADFWVGIEGGIEKAKSEFEAQKEHEMEAFAWVVIKSNKNQGKLEGKARTGTFFLPKKIVELIEQGKELGEADDIVFGHRNSKQNNGAVGILTGDVITRTTYYSEAVVLALIPFKNSEIY
ncbi:MAG: inosine/xanthosine triphosphatase [Nanoarchaeota archaeon]|nr:inosine/xanthosine triphosphatase [Nanoarchaeota archaeon]